MKDYWSWQCPFESELHDPTEWFFEGMLSEKYFRKMKPCPISVQPQRHWLAQAVQKARVLQQTLVAPMNLCPWTWTSQNPFRWSKYADRRENAELGLPQIFQGLSRSPCMSPKVIFSIPRCWKQPLFSCLASSEPCLFQAQVLWKGPEPEPTLEDSPSCLIGPLPFACTQIGKTLRCELECKLELIEISFHYDISCILHLTFVFSLILRGKIEPFYR